MFIVFEIAGPFKVLPIYEQIGPLRRVQLFWFSLTLVKMKFSTFLNKLTETQ